VIWLTGQLAPDFKTIADFPKGQRRGHSPGADDRSDRRLLLQWVVNCR
jgi:hypothetical protein